MTPHRRLGDHGEEMHERATDSDVVARTGAFLDRYKIWWVILISISAWWTRTVLVPLRESAETTAEVRMINKKIDDKVLPRLDSADADRSRLIRVQEMQGRQLGYLSRMQCLRLSPVDRVKGELDCRDIPIEPDKP